jgi:hypothetical protein
MRRGRFGGFSGRAPASTLDPRPPFLRHWQGAVPCFPHGRSCSWNSCSTQTALESLNGCKWSSKESPAGTASPNLSPPRNAPRLISPWRRWQFGRAESRVKHHLGRAPQTDLLCVSGLQPDSIILTMVRARCCRRFHCLSSGRWTRWRAHMQCRTAECIAAEPVHVRHSSQPGRPETDRANS